MRSIDATSRLGQFAWRQILPSSIVLPVIFRHENRQEFLCVQMVNIHLLSKYPRELISICMKQSPIEYFPLTKAEAKLFHSINQFHSNGSLAKQCQLDYSRQDLALITPFISFLQLYQLILSKVNKDETWKSYCRPIMFHDRRIMSYNTASANDSDETILCLSIEDVVSTYFPWTNIENFIQLCRLKQITRYKPDKSTHSDVSLRLINVEQLEKHWFYFIQQLLPDEKKIKVKTCPTNKLTAAKSEKIVEEQSVTSNEIVNKETTVEIECLINELITQIEQQVNADIFESKEEEIVSSKNANKHLKRKRRRSQKVFYRSKRRKRQQTNDRLQTWLRKYSIEPVSIVLQRVILPDSDK